jgi:histidine triad (HIT) family protein
MNREIPADIIYEDDRCFAIRDINPAAPSHILVIPRADIISLKEAEAKHENLLGHMLVVCSKIAENEKISSDGFRVVINSGEKAGQSVFQLHMHILGGRDMTWPPG